MSQLTFGGAEYAGKRKKTRRNVFLEEMEQVVAQKSLWGLIEPCYFVVGRGRHPYPLETMLRVYLMQNWFGLSDSAMEEALDESVPMRTFAGRTLTQAIPDETAILSFRHREGVNKLAPKLLHQVNAYLSRKRLLLKHGSIVAPTMVRLDRRKSRCCYTWPPPSKIRTPNWCASRKWRKRITVVSPGTGSRPKSIPTKACIARESYSASSTAGPERSNHSAQLQTVDP